MSGHAYLPPSSAHVWVKCGRWAEYNRTNPHGLDGDSESSAEGTASHWALAELLAGRDIAPGLIAPNGIALDYEMVECADFAQAEIAKLLPPGETYYSERRLDAGPSLGPNVWGTPDVIQADQRTLRVIDYKYGHGYVNEVGNLQLLAYARLALDYLLKVVPPELELELTIIQPRYFGGRPVRTWRLSTEDAASYWYQLATAAAKAGPDAPAVSGEHCQHCPGRLACPAFIADVSGCLSVTSMHTPVDLPVPAKAVQLTMARRALKMLTAAEDALAAHLMVLARTGVDVPGYAIKQSAGRKVWAKADDEILSIGAALGLELSKLELLTPNQAVKVGMPVELADSMTERKAGSMTLEPIDMRQVAAIFKE